MLPSHSETAFVKGLHIRTRKNTDKQPHGRWQHILTNHPTLDHRRLLLQSDNHRQDTVFHGDSPGPTWLGFVPLPHTYTMGRRHEQLNNNSINPNTSTDDTTRRMMLFVLINHLYRCITTRPPDHTAHPSAANGYHTQLLIQIFWWKPRLAQTVCFVIPATKRKSKWMTSRT